MKNLYYYNKNPSKTKFPDKNNRLPNKSHNIVRKITNLFYYGRSFTRISEQFIQINIHFICGKTFFDLNLRQQEIPTIADDGTCVQCHYSY